jgi:hypothetical protein
MVNPLPGPLRGRINPFNLTPLDCVELVLFAGEALKQCFQNDYSAIDFRTVVIHLRRPQQRFYGLRESDVAAIAMTPKQWADLAQFAGECFNSIDFEG